MNILITPEIPISLSTRTLILSARTLIASVHVFIALKNRISLSIRTLILFANALIAFGNFISLSARTLILSTRILIAPENPIRIRAQTLIAYSIPSGIACSPTVPGGDTPCLTAGDARRANPWESEQRELRRRRRRTAARFCTSELLLYAFSATPPASGSE